MAYPTYYGSHYAQDYDYNDHDISPTLVQDEFFPDQPRSQPGRHASHGNFGHFNDNDYHYNDHRYVAHSTPRYPENYQPIPISARPTGGHQSSYSPGSSPVSRHSEIRKPASPSPSSSEDRAYCNHPSCLDSQGNPFKSYSRKADVARHFRSAHERRFIDCPFKKCIRKGDHGFTRNDHQVEHRRQFHMEVIPKKGGSRDGGASGGGAGRKSRHST